jgi:flagellar operon protein
MDLRRIQGALEGLPTQPSAGKVKSHAEDSGEFARALEQAQGRPQPLHFSAHALDRMHQRGIQLTPLEMEKLENAVDTAAQKGSRSSLVLLDDRAFVVAVANRTVITAMEGESMKDQVVTQIDSAVIV